MNAHVSRALAGAALIGIGVGSAWFGTAVASAETPLPVCHMEDGSDAPSLPCVWTNQGRQWLTYADHSVLIGDAPALPCIPAPFIVIPGLVPGVVQCA